MNALGRNAWRPGPETYKLVALVVMGPGKTVEAKAGREWGRGQGAAALRMKVNLWPPRPFCFSSS